MDIIYAVVTKHLENMKFNPSYTFLHNFLHNKMAFSYSHWYTVTWYTHLFFYSFLFYIHGSIESFFLFCNVLHNIFSAPGKRCLTIIKLTSLIHLFLCTQIIMLIQALVYNNQVWVFMILGLQQCTRVHITVFMILGFIFLPSNRWYTNSATEHNVFTEMTFVCLALHCFAWPGIKIHCLITLSLWCSLPLKYHYMQMLIKIINWSISSSIVC